MAPKASARRWGTSIRSPVVLYTIDGADEICGSHRNGRSVTHRYPVRSGPPPRCSASTQRLGELLLTKGQGPLRGGDLRKDPLELISDHGTNEMLRCKRPSVARPRRSLLRVGGDPQQGLGKSVGIRRVRKPTPA